MCRQQLKLTRAWAIEGARVVCSECAMGRAGVCVLASASVSVSAVFLCFSGAHACVYPCLWLCLCGGGAGASLLRGPARRTCDTDFGSALHRISSAASGFRGGDRPQNRRRLRALRRGAHRRRLPRAGMCCAAWRLLHAACRMLHPPSRRRARLHRFRRTARSLCARPKASAVRAAVMQRCGTARSTARG